MAIDKDIWEETISKAKAALKKNDTDYMANKKEIVQKLAKDLEDQGMPLKQIANAIVHSLKDANISKGYILENLDKKYKRHYNKAKEEEQEQLSDNLTTIEDKKPIELSTTTSGATTTTTTNNPTPDEPSYPELEQQQQQPEPPKNQDVEVLKKQLSDTDKELHEKIEKLKDRESQIFRKDTEISDLKKQIETMAERRPEKPKPIINSNQLVLDEGKTFDNTIYLPRDNAKWLVGQIAKYLKDFPTLDFFLVQQDSDRTNLLRINLKKPQFITGNPH